MAESIWNIPLTSGEQIEVGLENGKQIFVIGANGSGKSALLHHCASHHYQQKPIQPEVEYKWIQAQRQIVINSGDVTLTSANRQTFFWCAQAW